MHTVAAHRKRFRPEPESTTVTSQSTRCLSSHALPRRSKTQGWAPTLGATRAYQMNDYRAGAERTFVLVSDIAPPLSPQPVRLAATLMLHTVFPSHAPWAHAVSPLLAPAAQSCYAPSRHALPIPAICISRTASRPRWHGAIVAWPSGKRAYAPGTPHWEFLRVRLPSWRLEQAPRRGSERRPGAPGWSGCRTLPATLCLLLLEMPRCDRFRYT